eukprot:3929000-Pyramimonas_sp.AAC.1
MATTMAPHAKANVGGRSRALWALRDARAVDSADLRFDVSLAQRSDNLAAGVGAQPSARRACATPAPLLLNLPEVG